MKNLAKEFGIEKIPSTSEFDGVPVLNNFGTIFYESPKDIDMLWNFFESVIEFTREQNSENKRKFIDFFDKTVKIKHNGISKVTIVLFAISPNMFLSLDDTNTKYIYESGKIKKSVIEKLPKFSDIKNIHAEKYLEIVEILKNCCQGNDIKDFKNLSSKAWNYSQEQKSKKSILSDNDKNDPLRLDEFEKYCDEKFSTTSGASDSYTKSIKYLSEYLNNYNMKQFVDEIVQLSDKLKDESSDEYKKLYGFLSPNRTSYLEKKFIKNSIEHYVEFYKLQKYLGQNVIFYGVPGCGKSHEIKKLLEGNEKYSKRVLFHPEYGYSDFVGQVMPVVEEDKVTYGFVSGPFVEILEEAYQDEDHKYFLIIEEINRGNAPAIFGDIFQLLDRDENGDSEYGIYNKEILKFLNEGKDENEKLKEVKIPRNLTILATMNTCDQNVFTLDTAFKRRWRMTRIKNDLDKASETLINNKFSWKDFVKALNYDILARCNDGMLAEDKLLGAYFVKESEIKNAQVFAEKIFMYLWNDVVKYNKEQLFSADLKTLDAAIENFVKGKNVFNDSCGNLASLYSKQDVNNAGENDR